MGPRSSGTETAGLSVFPEERAGAPVQGEMDRAPSQNRELCSDSALTILFVHGKCTIRVPPAMNMLP
jgi:hypothetical protein